MGIFSEMQEEAQDKIKDLEKEIRDLKREISNLEDDLQSAERDASEYKDFHDEVYEENKVLREDYVEPIRLAADYLNRGDLKEALYILSKHFPSLWRLEKINCQK